MERQLELHQEQKQILTPAQLQSLTLLTMPVQELSSFIYEQLLENPLLELGERIQESSHNEEAVFYANDDYYVHVPSGGVYDHGEQGYFHPETPAEQNQLMQSLYLQTAALTLDRKTDKAVKTLIHALDSNGYLTTPLTELSVSLDIDESVLEQALVYLQNMEPPGVGARDLRECLLLQIPKEHPEQELLCAVIAEHLDAMASGQSKSAAKALFVSKERMEQVFEHIRGLNPYPAAHLGISGQPVNYIIPDLYLEEHNNGFTLIQNDKFFRLRVDEYYLGLRNSAEATPEELNYLRQKHADAKMLINNVRRRHDTIAKIGEIVFSEQVGFFREGAKGLTPLYIKEVAEKASLHESTVSRAVAGKYVQTPRGVFPWKYFFPGLVARKNGIPTTDIFIKSILQEMICLEDKAKPLSDQSMTDMLNVNMDVCIARRTVTKYRQEMGFENQSRRKVQKAGIK